MSSRPEDSSADQATTGEAPGGQTPGSPGAGGPPGAGGRDRDAGGRDRDAAGRDRDAAGRARNARPRDALGRPLPRGATGDKRIPDDLALPPTQALRLAQELLDSDRPFHAHEVLEASWKSAPAAERDLWQGLAQIAVGLTHARRGNAHGASALLRRGANRVAGYADEPPHGIDAAGICRAAREMAARIDRDGAGAAGPLSARMIARSPRPGRSGSA